METLCLKCGSSEAVKSGHARGQQRYKCKHCGYQYTRTTPKGRPFKDKVLAVVLFLSGLSMNATATIVGVSAKTVYMWIKEFYHKYAEMPEPTGEVKEMEIDEMCHYLSKKNSGFGSGRLYVMNLGVFSDGSVDVVIQKR